MKYNILVCNMNDNPELKLNIEKYLKLNDVRYNIQELDESNNISNIYAHYTPDLVFLCNEFTAIDTAKKIKRLDENTAIVFITDNKKIKIDKYSDVFDDIIYRPLNEENLNIFIHNSFEKMRNNLKLFMFKYENKMNIIPYKDILYFEKKLLNIILYSKRGDFLIKEDMRVLSSTLDKSIFLRCHNNYIVNIKRVDSLKDNFCHIQNSDKTVPVGRKYKESIMKKLAV